MSIRKWKINTADSSLVSEIMSAGVPEFPARLLASRGISGDEAKAFLESTALPSPFDIKDMDKAVARINRALDNFERICIFGDYDCDGVTATVILEDYLENMGADIWHYIPDRAKGYGMNEAAIREIAEDGTNLIITVDNGISAIEEAELIYELGMELIVTDHHQVGEVLPRAEAVVNPHRTDDESFDGYCGAGVAFRLVCALEDGDNDFAFEQYGDLAALATVGDIVPLNSDNRTIVKNGLSLIEKTERLGLRALIEKSGSADTALNSSAVAFRLVPRINAAGRFSNAELALKLLRSEDIDTANSLADEICSTNEQRKLEEVAIFKKIEEQIKENPDKLNNRVLVFSGENWHYGVIGIVAARLLEMFRKPVIVLNIEENLAHGSARSIDGFSLYKALSDCSEHLVKFGGHHKAAGLTLNADKIADFERAIEEYAHKNFPEMPDDCIRADLVLQPKDISVDTIESAYSLEPFGECNPKPMYAILGAKITAVRPIKDGKFTQIQLNYGGIFIQVISFKTATSDFAFSENDTVDMLVNADVNEYKGNKRVSFQLFDIRPADFNEDRYFKAKTVYEDMKAGKGVNPKFISRICPERNDLVTLYKLIKNKTLTFDSLYFKASKENISYAMMMTALEAFLECGLCTLDYFGGKVSGLSSNKKVDIMSATAITKLKGE